MIRYASGNLLEAKVEALVNTVNEVGVMGKGIALMFKEAFPANAREYEEATKAGRVRVGQVLVTRSPELLGPRWIIHFPTKKHWRQPSRLEWIRDGLVDLRRVIAREGIRSIALPPLGCGNGGLAWEDVQPVIEAELGALADVEVVVYAPASDYRNVPKSSGAEELTPARALIAELVRRYLILGNDCTNLEVQKLAWFLDRRIRALGLEDPLRLTFTAHKYGPYADQLRHLLNHLDGSYLHCARRLSDAGPLDLIWFDASRRAAVEAYLEGPEGRPYVPALEQTAELIDGFESPLGMELLATVDWLLREEGVEPDAEALRRALGRWPGGPAAARRKQDLFDERLLGLALERLGAGAAR